MRKTLRKKKKGIRINDERKLVFYGAIWLVAFVVLLLLVLFVRGIIIQAQLERELALKLVFDDTYTVRVHHHDTGETEVVGLEEYIYHVVAGEMPLSYDIEALKAQAVAARTYTVQKCKSIMGDKAKCCGDGWDICTDSGHCQTWRSTERMRLMSGRRYYEYAMKLYTAVDETKGQILTYNGKPINAMYHSSSGGHTENIEDIYGGDPVPYLKGVESPGEEDFSDYVSTVKLRLSDAAEKINAALGTNLSAHAMSRNIKITKRGTGGAVISMTVDGKEVKGREFRRIFTLKSLNFDISFDNRYAIIKVKGFGHGVGMSQTGAGAMAKSGADYKEILTHYYTDVKLQLIGDL